jgi:tetratricopeptide (TPR) repeat protein
MPKESSKGKALEQKALKLPAYSHERAKRLHDAAWEWIHQGGFMEAEHLLSQAAAIYEPEEQSPYRQNTSSASAILSEVLCDWAMMQWRLAHYREAEASYQRALALRLLLYGEEHPAVAEVRSDLAGVYRYQGHFSEAARQLDKALQLQERLLGAEHPDVATTLRNQAALLRDQGQMEDVEPKAKRAIEIYNNAYGKESREALSVAKVLDRYYYLTGDYLNGLEHSRKTLWSMLGQLGERHPLVAGCYLNYGRFLLTDSPKQTRQYYQRALDIYEETFPEGHPFVSISLRALSSLEPKIKESSDKYQLDKLSRLHSSSSELPTQTHDAGILSTKKKALEIMERFYEPLHPFLYDFVIDLAEHSPEQEAQRLYQWARVISENKPPTSNIINDLLKKAKA